MAHNIADLFEHAVDAAPDNLAVKVGDRAVTYAELEADANRLAHYLQAQGVQPGDHVAIYAKNSIEHVVATLAIVKIRATTINVNYRYVESELDYIFDNADVVALIHERSYAPLVEKCWPKHEKLKVAVVLDDALDPADRSDYSSYGGVHYDEALAVANDTPFGLCAGIVTTSLKHATHFKRNAEVGMVMVNLPTAGVDPHVPFGGRKGSSYGPREQGHYAQEFFTTVKTAYTQP